MPNQGTRCRLLPGFYGAVPVLAINGSTGSKKWGRFVKLKSVSGIQVKTLPQLQRYGNLTLGSNCCRHD